MNATEKYRKRQKINDRQPAIVLGNPKDADSLLAECVTEQEKEIALYFKERAFI